MTVPTRARVLSIAAAVSVSCLALMLPAGAGAAESTVHFEKETVQAYRSQLAGGQIQSAEFNKRVRSLHLTLKDGRHVLIHYGPHEREKFEAELRGKGVPVTIEQPALAAKEAKKPVKHKLRYIVGGIVILVVLVVGAVLLVDRRRKAAAE